MIEGRYGVFSHGLKHNPVLRAAFAPDALVPLSWWLDRFRLGQKSLDGLLVWGRKPPAQRALRLARRAGQSLVQGAREPLRGCYEAAFARQPIPETGSKVEASIHPGSPEVHIIYDRDKLARSIWIATRKRGIEQEQVERIINGIVRRIETSGESEVPSRRIGELGGEVRREPSTELLLVNREFSVSVVLARCKVLDHGGRRWKVRFDTSLQPDITVAVRLDSANAEALDYYLLPRLDFGAPRLSLSEHNAIELESYRFDTLDYLYAMAERTRVRWAA